MKRIHQTIRVTANLMLMTLAFSGCTLIFGNKNSENQFDIVTVSSDHAHPKSIMVTHHAPTKEN